MGSAGTPAVSIFRQAQDGERVEPQAQDPEAQSGEAGGGFLDEVPRMDMNEAQSTQTLGPFSVLMS